MINYTTPCHREKEYYFFAMQISEQGFGREDAHLGVNIRTEKHECVLKSMIMLMLLAFSCTFCLSDVIMYSVQ